ncbi:energy transducer TonB [Spirosoma luteolum]
MATHTPPPPVALTLDDIVFQFRHRDYGAFDLRRHYRSGLTRALGAGIGLFWLGLALPSLYTHLVAGQQPAVADVAVDVTLTQLNEPEPVVPVVPPPAEPLPAVSTVRNLPPVVMPDPEVADDVAPPTTAELAEATSGPVTAEGTGAEEIIAPPEASAPTRVEQALDVTPTTDEPFVAVEQAPSYPGGPEALRQFLSRNLRYPAAATRANISGRVYVTFVVNTDGSLTDIDLLKGIGFGCDEEALRVVQKMARWQPGKQSGRPVRVRYNLPIAFLLE